MIVRSSSHRCRHQFAVRVRTNKITAWYFRTGNSSTASSFGDGHFALRCNKITTALVSSEFWVGPSPRHDCRKIFFVNVRRISNLASLSLAWILLFSVFCVCWALDPALLSCFFCWTWISRICNSFRWNLSHLCHLNDINASHMIDPNFKHDKLRNPMRTLNGSPLKLHMPVSKMSDPTPGWVPDAMA